MRLPKRDARKAPGRKAQVDGGKAPKQARVPRLRVGGRLGVEHLTGLSEDVVGAADPLLDLVVVDGSFLGGLLGGHLDVLLWK